MRYLHKVMPLPSEAELGQLGKDGWRVTASVGDKVVLVKEEDGLFHGSADAKPEPHLCGNCGSFALSKDVMPGPDGAGHCPEWNLLIAASNAGCVKWAAKGETTKSMPDEVSAWHWTPRTEIGEKRIEAITDQVAGLASPTHKHRVMVIRAKDGSVVRGKTDVVNGHDHMVKIMGMADESDGHTHTFLLPQES